MTAVIEIQNGLVSLTERTTSYQIPLAEWIDKIEKRSPIYTPVLPVGTRAIYWDTVDLTDQKFLVLIEQEPQIINLNFMGDVHRVSIPYTRFVFYCTTTDPTDTMAWHIGDYRVFWAKSQYRDPATEDMVRALVPNVYGDGRICFGSTGANMDQSLAERLNQTVNEFYVSTFNRDLSIVRPNGWRGWNPWERMTSRDPSGWMNWPDLEPTTTTHQRWSFDMVAMGTRTGGIRAARLAPMIAAEPIPEIPLGATFGRIQEWLDTLTDSQRDRLLQATLRDRALNNERYTTPVEDDDLEDPNLIEPV